MASGHTMVSMISAIVTSACTLALRSPSPIHLSNPVAPLGLGVGDISVRSRSSFIEMDLLTWPGLNLTGAVWTVDQETHHTVTVEFYDREAHRDFHFTDPYMYDKACLSESFPHFSPFCVGSLADHV
jgi:hypothetical protein